MPVRELEKVFVLNVNYEELAIQYALNGKNVILSSRNKEKLVEVQKEITDKTNRDISCFPIILVDVEKDDSFHSLTQVEALGSNWLFWIDRYCRNQ